jgi:hypothetical protein
MRILSILLLFALLASCRSTRPIRSVIAKRDTTTATGPTDSARVVQSTLHTLTNSRIPFQTFSSKVKVDYRGSDGKNYDVNANIRMLRDSTIWISVNALLGIEALRALITADSVKLIDKLNKTYTARSITYLQDVTSLPLDLPTLQDLIIGNAVFIDSNVIGYSQSGGVVSLLMLGKLFKNLMSMNASDSTLMQSKLDDVNVSRNRTANLSYSGYENRNGLLFSTRRSISVSEKKKLDIQLDFKQYDFNGEVSFPFSVPKNFNAP